MLIGTGQLGCVVFEFARGNGAHAVRQGDLHLPDAGGNLVHPADNAGAAGDRDREYAQLCGLPDKGDRAAGVGAVDRQGVGLPVLLHDEDACRALVGGVGDRKNGAGRVAAVVDQVCAACGVRGGGQQRCKQPQQAETTEAGSES